MTTPARSWYLALPSAITLLIGILLIAGGLQQLVWLVNQAGRDPSLFHDAGMAAGVAGIFGSGLVICGLFCIVLGVGVYYGKRWAIRAVQLMAWLMILMLAMVIISQWSAGPDRFVLITVILAALSSLWLWLIIRARNLVQRDGDHPHRIDNSR